MLSLTLRRIVGEKKERSGTMKGNKLAGMHRCAGAFEVPLEPK